MLFYAYFYTNNILGCDGIHAPFVVNECVSVYVCMVPCDGLASFPVGTLASYPGIGSRASTTQPRKKALTNGE